MRAALEFEPLTTAACLPDITVRR